MPNLAVFHPQIVHFVVALLLLGVALRLVSLTGKLNWTGPSAVTLLLIGTVAAWLAVRSGTDAHGPVERVPGSREAVQEHEEWGKKTRNIFYGVAALELIALGLAKSRWSKYGKGVLAASGVVGLWGVTAVYETAEHGGELVYSYAGGVGIRTGDSTDVGRLLTAGLYHQAMLDRRQGKSAEAAALIDQLVAQNPSDPNMQFLRIESLIQDKKDGKAALAALATIKADDPRTATRVGMLKVDAFEAAGQRDSARAVLQGLIAQFPQSQRLKDRLAQLQ